MEGAASHEKKAALPVRKSRLCVRSSKRLTFRDSIARANLCAATAIDASIGVDVIDIAFADRISRTYALACSACHAVVANYISHNSNVFYLFINYSFFCCANLKVNLQIDKHFRGIMASDVLI